MKFSKTLFLMMTLCLGPAAAAMAQNAPSGPVHFPPPNAAPLVPSAAPNPAPAPLNAAPAPSVPSNTATPPSAAAAEDIHDIRGPISIPYAWLWALYVAGGLALAAALYALWRLLRRTARARAKLPFEIALERLEAARALMTPATVREYGFTVSEIVRGYIEQRFGEKAAHRTTEEFLSDLIQQTGTPLALHRRRLEDFLSYCDLMKFARWELSAAEMESMHESARVFILDTRPQPEPAKTKSALSAANVAAPAQPELIEAQ